MEQVIAAIILAVIPAAVTVFTFRRNQSTLQNGLKTVIAEVHSDMQLTVLPTLADLRDWRDDHRGGIMSDRETVEAWLDRISSQFGSLDEAIAVVREELAAHVEWEQDEKYRVLESTIDKIVEDRK